MKTCGNVFNFEVWKLLDDLVRGEPRSQKIEDVCHANA
jgi:hypothetical protein